MQVSFLLNYLSRRNEICFKNQLQAENGNARETTLDIIILSSVVQAAI